MVHNSRFFTVVEIAERLGVNSDKVLGWIRSGELTGINTSADKAGRPRWRIPESSFGEFLIDRQSRAVANDRPVGRKKKMKTRFD